MKVAHRLSAAGVLVVLAAVAVSACGSSDSGSPPADPGDVVIGDPSDPSNLPPSIVSRTPADGDGQVSVRAPIQVKFSKRVQLGASPVTVLVGDKAVAATSSLSPDNFTLTITPNEPIVAPAKVSVSFGDISDLKGAALASKPSWSWRTPSWFGVADPIKVTEFRSGAAMAAGPGDRVSVSIGDASGWRVSATDGKAGPWTNLGGPEGTGRLAIGKDGSLISLGSDVNSQMRLRRWSGTTWDNLGGTLGKAYFGIEASRVASGLDATGTPFVAYRPDASGPRDLFVYALENGVWSQIGSGPVNDPSEGVSEVQSIIWDRHGGLYIAYINGLPNGGDETHVRVFSGGAWKLFGPAIPAGTQIHRSANIGFDDAGNLFAIENVEDDKNSYTRVFGYDGKAWSTIGAELPLGLSPICLVGRGQRLFALASPYGKTPASAPRAFLVTKSGWSEMELPSVAPSTRTALCDSYSDGTLVIALAPAAVQNGDIGVYRLNW